MARASRPAPNRTRPWTRRAPTSGAHQPSAPPSKPNQAASQQQQQQQQACMSRQQLAARARAITAKLTESSGAELRRTLFSLRQIFQDEPRLAAEFVEAAEGIECLLGVAARSEADQIHQNYILRAIGQLIAHPATMQSLARRQTHTLRWLYSLLDSQHRLLARSALGLLASLVEADPDSQCPALSEALEALDGAKGEPPWTRLARLLRGPQAPPEPALLLQSLELVNRTLAREPDPARFFRLAQPLEELLEVRALARKWAPQLASDARLRDQFELLERTVAAVRREAAGVSRSSSTSSSDRAQPVVGQIVESSSSKEPASIEPQLATGGGYHLKSAAVQAAATMAPPCIHRQDHHASSGPQQTAAAQLPPRNRSNSTSDTAAHLSSGVAPQGPAKLARGGRHQRASISSCSSSDSYASYGSGYASGSGNSTDHEPKRAAPVDAIGGQPPKTGAAAGSLQVDQSVEAGAATPSAIGAQATAADRVPSPGATRRPSTGPQEEPDEGWRLKRHLNELEQLTDDLAASSTALRLEQEAQQAPEVGPRSDSPSSQSPPESVTPTSSNQGSQQKKHQPPTVSMAPQSTQSTKPQVAPQNKQQQQQQQQQEPYYHNLFQWEQLVGKGVTRPLFINDLDFTDLRDEDDCDLLTSGGGPLTIRIPPGGGGGSLQDSGEPADSGQGSGDSALVAGSPGPAPPMAPPPPLQSPWFSTLHSRPQSQLLGAASPAPSSNGGGGYQRPGAQSPTNSTCSSSYSAYLGGNQRAEGLAPLPAPLYSTLQPAGLRSASSMSSLLFGGPGGANRYLNKRKKTMKLFWKEVREERSLLAKLTRKRTIWDEIQPVQVDTNKLEDLFESKAKDLVGLSKSRMGLDGVGQRRAKISVLDAKRSNAINIGMTKLPPMRTIKSAILKMDSSIMNREGIEKILTTMMPSEEEKSRIIEAQLANPDTPLGTAEQFLLNLASISALEARLKLWAFQLDYAQIEKEVAEPLMDLKQAIDEIEKSESFRLVLGTLLAIGNFLNSSQAKGFQIDYLEKVPEVKDTVHKHSLLHHLCLFMEEKAPQASDLYSEFGAVNRASKVDYAEVAKSLRKMQQDCKASWDHLRIVAKHDGLANLMNTPSSSSTSSTSSSDQQQLQQQHTNSSPGKPSGKLNNLSKLSMITTVIGGVSESTSGAGPGEQATGKQLKTRVSDFLTDCAERIMVLMVVHRRVMNRFQRLLVYLGCPSHQIKQTQPQQMLKIINEFALEYRTKRERVREMLAKQHQCAHHRNHPGAAPGPNRWLLNRNRWAGSQQSLSHDLHLNHQHHHLRPCSTASSYANSSNCLGDTCKCLGTSGDGKSNQQHLRPGSPSAMSQASSVYEADYQSCYEHSCCSRQSSVTPVPMNHNRNHNNNNNNSLSMFDLQQNRRFSVAGGDTCGRRLHEPEEEQREEEKLKQLLGADKSLETACGDLYQMGHFTSTLARTTRHQPAPSGRHHQQRAMSIDSSAAIEHSREEEEEAVKRQSSYYRYLHSVSMDQPARDNSDDEEILQSLLRTVAATSTKPGHHHQHHHESQQRNSHQAAANRSARNKILSRFSCDRKSLRRSPRAGVEVPNVG